ncbi:hypothetical protein NDU88_006059 [Pleurodeles waltl]|uniref:Uncharacterized protein n=1 Tax=Pleurodeles waltl TaxID=8319 RepID=A0AAV7NP71_PLEWA|nr:hypothetical protein NDU88_006059 [Pleurodeles waltl]
MARPAWAKKVILNENNVAESWDQERRPAQPRPVVDGPALSPVFAWAPAWVCTAPRMTSTAVEQAALYSTTDGE